MKLINYNRANTNAREVGCNNDPLVRITNDGLVSFSKFITASAGLKPGSHVEFFQSEEDSRDWYFAVTNNQSGFKVRQDNQGRALVNCAAVAKKVNKAAKQEGNSIKYKISSKPLKHKGLTLWLIILSSGVPTTRSKRIAERVKDFGS